MIANYVTVRLCAKQVFKLDILITVMMFAVSGLIATSTSGFPSLSSPEIVGIGFDAFRLLASVASGWGVVVARKWTEVVSCC